jgi:hypothetical protein
MRRPVPWFLIAVTFLAVPAIAAETLTIPASRDAAIYEGDGTIANGSGSYLFIGRNDARNGATERRSFVAFDIVGSIPSGATITEVSLGLTVSRTGSGAQAVGLHRVLESWSEGPSDAGGQEGGGATAVSGDVTWVHREFPGTEWATPGGSFAVASASRTITGTGAYTYASTAQLVADVQAWLDDPATNHGWALVMESPPAGSAKRFNSRDNGSAQSRPMLTVTYEPGIAAPNAEFSFSPSSPEIGEDVSFTDSSSGSPTTWAWDFGDGESSTEQNPTHSYDEAGTYNVELTVSNGGGSDSTTSSITVLESEPELTELIFVPAAANASGDGGSFFITTVDVHNSGNSTASFRILWLPRGADNSTFVQSEIFALEAGEVRRFDNILAEVFEATGVIGAVALLSDSGDLKVMSRTFNQPPDSEEVSAQATAGTFGQSIPGVPSASLIPAGTRVRVLFLSENAGFRSNLGILNGVGSPITVQWELFDADGNSLRTGQRQLAAWSNIQLNRVLQDFAPIEAAYADVWTTTSGGAFTCYGSVLDEISSDPTTVLPQ